MAEVPGNRQNFQKNALSSFSSTVRFNLANTGDTTTWLQLSGDIAVQFSGGATACNVQMERSTQPPAGTPNPAPAGDPISGNPSNATMQPRLYTEPGLAYWRARLVSKTGANVVVDITGEGVR